MKQIFWSLLVLILFTGCWHNKNTQTTVIKVTDTLKDDLVPQKLEKVMMSVFFDFGSGPSRDTEKLLKKLKLKFSDKLIIDRKHFPLRPTTFIVAEASECARDQGMFQEYLDGVFKNFGHYASDDLIGLSEKIGLDREQFLLCMKSGYRKDLVVLDQRLGEKFGVAGVPFFVLNDNIRIPTLLPIAHFENVISKLLNGEKL